MKFLIVVVLLLTASIITTITADTTTANHGANKDTILVNVPAENIHTAVVGEPVVVQTLPEKSTITAAAAAAATIMNDAREDSVASEMFCSVIVHINGLEPSKKYEARVSFPGSPAMRYDIHPVRLVVSSSEKNEQDGPPSNRRLLDTERAQFSTSTTTTLSEGDRQFVVQYKTVAEKQKQQKRLAVFRAMFPDGNNGTTATTEFDEHTSLCINIFRFGVPSKRYADEALVRKQSLKKKKIKKIGNKNKESSSSSSASTSVLDEYEFDVPAARFVVTVDEMLMGVLPGSAVSSVVCAAAFVLSGVAMVLPRILGTLNKMNNNDNITATSQKKV